MVTLEQILDKIADAIMLNINLFSGNPKATILQNQKTIRNGLVQLGIESQNERLLLFQEDLKANSEDNITELSTIVNSLNTFYDNNGGLIPDAGIITSVIITISGGGEPDYSPTIFISDSNNALGGGKYIENFIYDSEGNPLNVGQFLTLSAESSRIDSNKAKEYLDTNIFELLPTGQTRQQRIDQFFKEFEILAGNAPNYITDEYGDLSTPENYSEEHDISAAQDTPDEGIQEEDSFITRTNFDANNTNNGKTLQTLRNQINEYLKDIDQTIDAGVVDERPEYQNKSDGYLKIRGLNQGIIVRKQEGDAIGLEKQVKSDLHVDETHQCHPANEGGPSYLCDGFTITMWVKFLDKTSKGTLFNYANPLRSLDPKGIRLETYIIDKDETMNSKTDFGNGDGDIYHTWGEYVEFNSLDLFTETDSERFIRLVVRDHLDDDEISTGRLYDSHIGMIGHPRNHKFIPEFNIDNQDGYGDDYNIGDESYLLNHLRVPIDFDEWFFIVANYNPAINDTISVDEELLSNGDFWRGNLEPDGTTYTHYSSYGTKCKVEIISKSDLLRARGYKPE